jgi:hypothetical protein
VQQFAAARFLNTALDTWASFVDTEIVTQTVAELTGRPAARSFAEWTLDHTKDFR